MAILRTGPARPSPIKQQSQFNTPAGGGAFVGVNNARSSAIVGSRTTAVDMPKFVHGGAQSPKGDRR